MICYYIVFVYGIWFENLFYRIFNEATYSLFVRKYSQCLIILKFRRVRRHWEIFKQSIFGIQIIYPIETCSSYSICSAEVRIDCSCSKPHIFGLEIPQRTTILWVKLFSFFRFNRAKKNTNSDCECLGCRKWQQQHNRQLKHIQCKCILYINI